MTLSCGALATPTHTHVCVCVRPQVFAHGFLTKDGLKMGKSLGNTLDPKVLELCTQSSTVYVWYMLNRMICWRSSTAARQGKDEGPLSAHR